MGDTEQMRSRGFNDHAMGNSGPLLRAVLACWRAVGDHRSRGAKAGRIRQMELIEVLGLGGRREMMLVRCGGERYLVAASGEHIQSVTAVSGRAEHGVEMPVNIAAGDEVTRRLENFVRDSEGGR